MADDYPEIAARFARETAQHRMTVLHDEGLYRHLVFADPTHGFSWFEIITTPGQLVFSGDGESFVFRRTTDMFQFFRSGMRRDGSIRINPGYWSQKLASDRDSATKYDRELVERLVKEQVVEAIREGWAPRGIGKAVREDVLDSEYLDTEDEARRVLYEFEYGVEYAAKCSCTASSAPFDTSWETARWRDEHQKANGPKHKTRVEQVAGFDFQDASEWDLRDYSWWFLWACHAAVWGIARYDRVRGYGLQQLAAPAPRAVAA